MGRGLGLSGATNARDIGGYATARGPVRTGRVYRSDALAKLTDDDLAALAGAGVTTVVDLRGQSEVDQLGADRLPPGVTAVHLPILDATTDLYRLLGELIGSRDAVRQRAELADGGGERFMTDMYRWFVSDEGARDRFGALLRRIADAGGTPLLYHCTAGKDRTGWTTAVLLTLLGVDRDTVYEDYLASNPIVREAAATMLAGLRGARVMAEPELLQPLLDVRPEYLAAAFDEVDRRFGTFDGFVADGLGLDAGVRAALADALLDGH
ncbi:tyrosine-protein phosphatase [Actinocatenispora rupis]|uniref:Protein-tyrosine-phosphatase n=1 Tax=Actinocatenispora rupis TaxID=519421 RepID=A0A8J3IV76_9ACTN|nr:tyrosine-protein phosphatase [Actinocatenispora rupis]GID09383.1 protein-tyrosine-phosphatase [Actinocatenispora rupis]